MNNDTSRFAERRHRMVEAQLMPRGINDPATLESMSNVPRHVFVSEALQNYAYDDGPLQIGYGQTISQPYIVAIMTQAAELGPSSTVLEIGTGSGYGAAVLSQVAKEVYTVERIPELANQAEKYLKGLGYDNVHVKIANGTLGWAEKGPFDAIIVTAAGPEIPEPLFEQLKPEGRLIIPLGDLFAQNLVKVHKSLKGKYTTQSLGSVRFVPLIGEEGWHD